MNNKKKSYLGKKIFYTLVIAISALVLLLNVAGIIGVWTVGRLLGNATIAALKVVENTANDIQKSTAKVDARLVTFQDKVKEIMDATQKLSANVSDKGLVLVLLPEKREQELTDRADAVRETISGIKESLSTAVEMYRSIDDMPLINLPNLDKDQRAQLDQALDTSQSETGPLRSAIADFRSGATDKIDKVDAAASQLNDRIQNARDRVAKMDAKMAALEATSKRIQLKIQAVFDTFSVIFTLLFAFVIWSQVEMIRKYSAQWKLLGQGDEPVILPAASIPALPAVEEPVNPVKKVKSAKPAKPVKKKSKPAKKK
jgi:predicted  nucleic acid-binding Zn-ribbon protein